LKLKKVRHIRARRIEADPDQSEPILLELDGEQLGTLPAVFEIVPGSLPVIGYL
jgi:diacylglycerol kinase family enzyme